MCIRDSIGTLTVAQAIIAMCIGCLVIAVALAIIGECGHCLLYTSLSFGEYLMFKSQYTEVGEPKAELVEKILRFIATVNLYTFEYLLIN